VHTTFVELCGKYLADSLDGTHGAQDPNSGGLFIRTGLWGMALLLHLLKNKLFVYRA
jgi:hypothetical protein